METIERDRKKERKKERDEKSGDIEKEQSRLEKERAFERVVNRNASFGGGG